MSRMDRINAFQVMDIHKEANRYQDIIHFEIGEPDLPPSPKVIAALHQAIDDRRFGYVNSLGIMPLRKKIAEHYHKTYGISISPERVIITVGTSGAFLVAYSMLLNRGERIALTDPSYPCYKNFAYLFDIEPVFIPLEPANGFHLSLDSLRTTRDIRALHLPSPSNPLGTVYDKNELRKIVEYCDENKLYFISDEIYHGLTYKDKAHSALEFSDNAIVINGFSKLYALPGLRLGWMIVPDDLVRQAEIVIQNVSISAPTISQYACLEAFDYADLEKSRQIYMKRRDFLYNELKTLFPIHARPDGAFYIWADISEYGLDSEDFSKLLLKQIHVGVTPGTDFGSHHTADHIRLAYTRDISKLREGVARLRKFLPTLKRS